MQPHLATDSQQWPSGYFITSYCPKKKLSKKQKYILSASKNGK